MTGSLANLLGDLVNPFIQSPFSEAVLDLRHASKLSLNLLQSLFEPCRFPSCSRQL